jgi:hypothetical protein
MYDGPRVRLRSLAIQSAGRAARMNNPDVATFMRIMVDASIAGSGVEYPAPRTWAFSTQWFDLALFTAACAAVHESDDEKVFAMWSKSALRTIIGEQE